MLLQLSRLLVDRIAAFLACFFSYRANSTVTVAYSEWLDKSLSSAHWRRADTHVCFLCVFFSRNFWCSLTGRSRWYPRVCLPCLRACLGCGIGRSARSSLRRDGDHSLSSHPPWRTTSRRRTSRQKRQEETRSTVTTAARTQGSPRRPRV